MFYQMSHIKIRWPCFVCSYWSSCISPHSLYNQVSCVCFSMCMCQSPVFPWDNGSHFVLSLLCAFLPLCLSNNDSLICHPITPKRYLNEPIRTSDKMTSCSSQHCDAEVDLLSDSLSDTVGRFYKHFSVKAIRFYYIHSIRGCHQVVLFSVNKIIKYFIYWKRVRGK